MKPDMEEVLQMAREAGFDVHSRKECIRSPHDIAGFDITTIVERFYALAYEAGARAEREECAKVADEWGFDGAAAIRARTT